jgi:hypothetical protein
MQFRHWLGVIRCPTDAAIRTVRRAIAYRFGLSVNVASLTP